MLGNTPNAFTEPVADTVMGYMLTFARQGPWMDQAMKAGYGKRYQAGLWGVHLGVIGVGNIGSAVMQRAQPFEMTLLGNDIRGLSRNL